jgi:hypothetical protein
VPAVHPAAAAIFRPQLPIISRSSAQGGAGERLELAGQRHGDGKRHSRAPWQLVVDFLDLPPAPALRSGVVVNRDEQLAAARHRERSILERFPHAAGVVQDAPGIHDVEGTQCAYRAGIENRGLLDDPIGIGWKVPPSQFARARDRLRIVIERMNPGTEASRRQARETASRSDVQKPKSVQPFQAQHVLERALRRHDSLVVQDFEEPRPVAAELEPFAARNFRSVCRARGHGHCGCNRLVVHP